MAFPVRQRERVSQSKYWTLFGIYLLLAPTLLIGGVVTMVTTSVVIGLLMIFALLPLGIYWRVIMTRRCRDIGWPTFLPWLIYVVQVLLSFGLPSPQAGEIPSLSVYIVPLLLAVGDFAFSIVIGCIRSKDQVDYAEVFGDGPAPYQQTRPLGAGGGGGDGGDPFDAAIARALEAHRRGESVVSASAGTAPRAAPAMPARPATGFGRRVI